MTVEGATAGFRLPNGNDRTPEYSRHQSSAQRYQPSSSHYQQPQQRYHSSSSRFDTTRRGISADATPAAPFGMRRVQPTTAQRAATPSTAAKQTIHAGATVEHQRFGIGKVVSVVGVGENEKATIEFQNAGTKTLLMKFARLKIIGWYFLANKSILCSCCIEGNWVVKNPAFDATTCFIFAKLTLWEWQQNEKTIGRLVFCELWACGCKLLIFRLLRCRWRSLCRNSIHYKL